jgi:PAS domain S-box-containing protein
MVKKWGSSCRPTPPVCPLDAAVARRLSRRNRLGLHVDARAVRRARLRRANEVCDRDTLPLHLTVMGSTERSHRITEKLARGLLPTSNWVEMTTGFGNGRPCDGCDQAIQSSDIQHEVDLGDDRTLRLHDACAALWQRNAGAQHPNVPGRPVSPFGASDDHHARALLASIVDSSDDAIVSKTLDGVITSWNGGAERMLGWPAETAIGRHIMLIVPEDRRAEEEEVLARIRRGERIDHFETVRVTRDGRRIDVSLTVSPVRDAAGRIVGASKVARDVSERRRLDEYRNRLLAEAQQARAASENLIRAKDQLLATISHELRTPLNAIFGWARLLDRSELDARSRKRAITAIVAGAMAQAQLVDDLLDLSRLATGRLSLDLGPVSLRDVVNASLDVVRPAANAKDITLVATLADVGPMRGAPNRLQQVVWNIVANAVKFTPRGGRIDVILRRTDDLAELVVADNGEGISPDQLPYVFREFWQEDNSSTRAHQGLGLGLTLVKHLVELHGGHVRAASGGKGRGATFTVELPLTTRQASAPDSGGD